MNSGVTRAQVWGQRSATYVCRLLVAMSPFLWRCPKLRYPAVRLGRGDNLALFPKDWENLSTRDLKKAALL